MIPAPRSGGSTAGATEGSLLVPGLLRAAASTRPDAVAVAVDGGSSLSVLDWHERSDAVACGLASRGVRPGDRVGLVFDAARWTDHAVAWAGTLRAGAVAVPMVPTGRAVDVSRVLADCAPVAVVCPPDLALPGNEGSTTTVAALEDLGRERTTVAPPVTVDASGPAEVLYRTGPLVRPGGVTLPHRRLLEPPLGIRGEDPVTVVHAFPPGSRAGQEALRLPIHRPGSSVTVLADPDPARLWHLVGELAPAVLGLPPFLARLVLDHPSAVRGAGASVRHVVVSGPLPPALLSRLAAAFPGAAVDALAVPPAPAPPGAAPLSSAQEGMAWYEQFAPGSFNMQPMVRRLSGELDVDALAAAFTELVRRHSVLRTSFELVDGRVLQVVPALRPVEVPVTDLRGRPREVQDEEVARAAAAANAVVFDLLTGPLVRPSLLRLGDEEHVLVLPMHHLGLDDWSLGLMRKELSALYAAFRNRDAVPLPDPPLQFADFCRRQREELSGATGAAQVAYWRRELAGAPLSVELPIDDPSRPAGATQHPAGPFPLVLSQELTAAVRRLARQHRSTTFMAVLAAFNALVARTTGQDDIVVATVAANRNRTELERVIGCFAKKVLVRARVDDDPPFPELVARVRRSVLGALGHQDVPYETILEEALGASAAAHGLTPQVSVMLQGLAAHGVRLDLPGVEPGDVDLSGVKPMVRHFTSARTADETSEPWGGGLSLGTFLGLFLAEGPAQIQILARGTFHVPTVQRLLVRFRTVLEDLVEHPEKRVSELTVLTDEDSADLARWNRTALEMPAMRLDEAIAAAARRHPDRTAATYGGVSITYAELEHRAEHLARRLRAAGTRGDCLVAVAVAPSVDVVVATVSVWKAGGACLAGGAAVSAALAVTGQGDGELEIVRRDEGGTSDVEVTEAPAGGSGADAGDRALAWVTPDGVQLEHRALANTAAGLAACFGESEDEHRARRWCAPAAPVHPAFLRRLAGLASGDTLALVSDPAAAEPNSVLTLLADAAVDAVDLTEGDARSLLAAGLAGAVARRPAGAPPPEIVVACGDGPDAALWRALGRLEGARTHVVYAPSATVLPVTAVDVASSARPVVGRPLANVTVHVLDHSGRPVPPRVTGELHLGGATVARSGAACGSGLHATGQLARHLPDGALELLGLPSDHAHLRGFLVRRSRIEAALAAASGVAEAAVVLRSDDAGEPLLVAYVVPEPATTPTLLGLRSALWADVPGYAWPAALVVVASLPRGVDGSVNPGALPPAPPPPAGPVAPRTPEERLLAALWAEAVGAEQVSVHREYWQNFSFLDAVSRGWQAGAPVPADLVARNRTVETLAAALAATRSE